MKKEERIMVVSTSLIEAGVDLDFETVYREFTGLDSILQCINIRSKFVALHSECMN